MSPPSAVAQRVVDQDPHHAGDRVRVAAAPARAVGRDDLDRGVALAGAQAELGRDGARELAELDRLGAQRDRGVEPREVEQLLGERREAQQLAPRGRDLALGVGHVGVDLVEVLRQQLHRALEHRQRRAQLVRRGRHERAPRRLLAAQLLLHARQRAGEVADLVVAGVARHRDVGALGRDPQRRGAQAAEPPQQRAGEQERERDRDEPRPTPAAASSALRTSLTALPTSVSRRRATTAPMTPPLR